MPLSMAGNSPCLLGMDRSMTIKSGLTSWMSGSTSSAVLADKILVSGYWLCSTLQVPSRTDSWSSTTRKV